MTNCQICKSYAINHDSHGRDGTDENLCDVCYWRKRAQPALADIEQYRMQMAGISTAAYGYWKKGDSIHPDYLTVALGDVADLYTKYDELFQRLLDQPVQPAIAHGWVLVPNEPATPTPDYKECARQATVATGLQTQYPSAWLSIFIREINRWCQHAAQPAQPTELNFCARCGKRLGGTNNIHTCTLPTLKETK